MRASVQDLHWEDVIVGIPMILDRHRLVAWAREVVERHDGQPVVEVLTDFDDRLVRERGPWALGWAWSNTDGGPVTAWCCLSHSLADAATDPDGAASRMADALLDWQRFLSDVRDLFASVDQTTVHLGAEHALEAATVDIVDFVVRRTATEDAWYSLCNRVLTWFVQWYGFDAPDVRETVRELTAGRFESWMAPSLETISEVARDLGLRVPALPALADTTAAWRPMRAVSVAAHDPADVPRSADDGHRRYIDEVDAPRDAGRADAMHVALDACREAAGARAPLTPARLVQWQRIVLGRSVSLRTDAWAACGPARYPPLDAEEFAGWLSEADGSDPFADAARVYLDICFTHPFPDGNARCARLAMDYVLSRAGLVLTNPHPLFRVRRHPYDAWTLQNYAWLVHRVSAMPAA